MKFGNLELTQEQLKELELFLGHCVGPNIYELTQEVSKHITDTEQPDWDKIEPVIDIEQSTVTRFELHYGGGQDD